MKKTIEILSAIGCIVGSILTLGLLTRIEITYKDEPTQEYSNVYSLVYQRVLS